MLKCIQCNKYFAKKTVFSDCKDCKTCPRFCDSCQTTINQKSAEIKGQIKDGTGQKTYPIQVRQKAIEVSMTNPFLVKQTYEMVNTEKGLCDYSYWKIVEDIRILWRPLSDKDMKQLEQDIKATRRWIDFSKQVNEHQFADLTKIEMKEGKCDYCSKLCSLVVQSPFPLPTYNPDHLDENNKFHLVCQVCLKEIIEELKQKVHPNHESFKREVVLAQELNYIFENI